MRGSTKSGGGSATATKRPDDQLLWLVHANAGEALERARSLEKAGYRVLNGSWSAPEIRRKREDRPAAVIIDLTRTPSMGRDVAVAMRSHRAMLTVPFVLAGGSPDNIARIKQLLPDAIECDADWAQMPAALRSAICNPPREPARLLSVFAAYQESPLPKKLGIKPPCIIAMPGAPRGFERILGDLPEGAKIVSGAAKRRDLTLWIVPDQKRLATNLPKMTQFAERGGLWIIWAKKSAPSAGALTQTIVRKAGLAAGLVDFKICRIDDNWAGLRFTRRK